MSEIVLDSDSSDSDIFVVKQIKPVNNLTLQQALIIKHNVLHSHQVKNEETSSNSKEKNKGSTSHGKKSKKDNLKPSKSTNQKNMGNSTNDQKRKVSTYSIDRFFLKQTPEKNSSENSVKVEEKIVGKVEENVVENIEFELIGENEISDFITSLEKRRSDDTNFLVSPDTMKKRKRFKVLDEDSSQPNKNSSSPSKQCISAVKKLFDEEKLPECKPEINFESDKIKVEVDDCLIQLNESESNSSSTNLLNINNLCTPEVNDTPVELNVSESNSLSKNLLNINNLCKPEVNFKSDKIKVEVDDCLIQLNESESNSLSKNLLNITNLCKPEINFESDKIKIEVNESESNSSSTNLLSIINLCGEISEDKLSNNHELLCFSLKTIIKEEIEKQLVLEKNALEDSKKIEKLITKEECEILERFLNLNEKASKLLVRLLCRKRCWHRVSTFNYNDISNDLKQEIKLLHQGMFVDINVWDEELSTQLNLLTKVEVQQICKTFNIPYKAYCHVKKEDLISMLINNTKSQKSVVDMMHLIMKSSRMESRRMDLLKRETINCLGLCVRLNKKTVAIFDKIIILFSFPHFFDEEKKRFGTQLFTRLKVIQNSIKYPEYKLSPTVVFETVFDFEQYKKSLVLIDLFEIAISTKRHEDFEAIKNTAKEEFKNLLNNEEYKNRIQKLEPFLKKFSALGVYARILTRYCLKFKKLSSDDEIINIMELLLDQDILSKGKRGKWCEILVQAYENKKYNNKASEILIKFLQDSKIDEVQKLTLQLRSQTLLKKKTNSVDDSNLKETLDDLCTVAVEEPPSIEIKGKALTENDRGSKSVYVENTDTSRIYISVEALALLHYKTIGFSKGYHNEGFIVHSVFFLLFFDIIYGLSPPGVFQSSYQEEPLDFNSKYFYINRKGVIDSRLNEMCEWSEEELEAKLKDAYDKHSNTQCLITWKEGFTPEFFSEFVKCLTMPILSLICRRLVENFRVFRSGFPDLTLWNPETKKCKFVEVKSPNDRLSPNQRVWLDYLRKIGVDCEVCNVRNVASKV